MMLRAMAVATFAALCISCSSSSDTAGVSQAEADALAESLTLEPSDVGPGFVDYTAGLSQDIDLADCTPDLPVLAQTPGRSYGTGLEDAEPADAAAVIDDAQQLIVKSLVYDSTASAHSAFELIAATLRAGSTEDPPCLQGAAADRPIAPVGSLESGGESVILSESEQVTIVLVRNGPTLTLLVPVLGSMDDNRDLLERVAGQLAAIVAETA